MYKHIFKTNAYMPEDWKNAGLKTTQHGLLATQRWVNIGQNTSSVIFDPDGRVKRLISLKIKITHRITIGNSNNQNMDIYY